MLVAMIAKLRNGLLVKYRQDNGLTQKAAGEAAGVSVQGWGQIECMRFKDAQWHDIVSIAELLNVPCDEICPPELRNVNLHLEATAFRHHEAKLLAAHSASERLALPDPAKEVETKETSEALKAALRKILRTLTYREREIINLRYGLGEDGFTYTLEEVGRIFKVTRERVREVEAKAIRKLQHPVRSRQLEAFLDDPNPSDMTRLKDDFIEQLQKQGV